MQDLYNTSKTNNSESTNTDIYNRKNHSAQSMYDAFNEFIFSNDRRVFGKLLYRYDFF